MYMLQDQHVQSTCRLALSVCGCAPFNPKSRLGVSVCGVLIHIKHIFVIQFFEVKASTGAYNKKGECSTQAMSLHRKGVRKSSSISLAYFIPFHLITWSTAMFSIVQA